MKRRHVVKLGGAVAVGVPALSGVVTAAHGRSFPVLDIEFDLYGTHFNGPGRRIWSGIDNTGRPVRVKRAVVDTVNPRFTAPEPNAEKKGRPDDETEAFMMALYEAVEDEAVNLDGDYRPFRLEVQTGNRRGDALAWGHLHCVKAPNSSR